MENKGEKRLAKKTKEMGKRSCDKKNIRNK